MRNIRRLLVMLMLLYSAAAQVEAEESEAEDVQSGADIEPMIFTPPVRVGSLQQGTNFGGVTFVRLIGVACPGRSDSHFILPNSSKQPLELNVLLLALDRGFLVRIDYNPSTCVAASVGVCAIGPC